MVRNNNLNDIIESRDIRAKIHEFEEAVETVKAAADVLEVETKRIIKSLVFIIDGEPFLVIGKGTKKIDTDKIKDFKKCEEIVIASPNEVKELTGYAIGEVPPIGVDLPKIIDRDIMEMEKVYGGGGTKNKLLEIDPSDLVKENTQITDIQ